MSEAIMGNLLDLIQLTKLWFEDVGLTEKGTPEVQAEKGIEEAIEYLVEIKVGERLKEHGISTREQQINELGDKFVTLIGDSLINDIPLEEALYFAYQKIHERKGKGKIINNSFVKESDLK